jgi:hypothetical protein
VPWWKRKWANRWIGFGAIGTILFGIGFLLRWFSVFGPSSRKTTDAYVVLTLGFIVILIVGLLLERHRTNTSDSN